MLKEVASTQLTELRLVFTRRGRSVEAIAEAVGGHCAGNGLWRFYSRSYPSGGIEGWNRPAAEWRQAWRGMPGTLVFFGEDLFGNQLCLHPERDSVLLWHHESGELEDMELDLLTVLEAAETSGLSWLDVYGQEITNVAGLFRNKLKDTEHLHWTTPLVLGGAVEAANVTVLERSTHLVGHARLWDRIKDIPPGGSVILK